MREVSCYTPLRPEKGGNRINCSKGARGETLGKTSLLKSTSRWSKGTSAFSGGDPGLKGWRPERSSSANSAQQSEILETASVGTKCGKRKAFSLKPILKGAGRGRTLCSSRRPSAPFYLVGQKSEALRKFSLGSGQKWEWGPSDIGLLGINRPLSVPSPGLLPAGFRMSAFLLCCSV